MRRLPGPAGDGLGEGGNSRGSLRFVSGLAENTTLNLLCGLFWSLRQQMDVRFCGEQEPQAERHNCVTVDT